MIKIFSSDSLKTLEEDLNKFEDSHTVIDNMHYQATAWDSDTCQIWYSVLVEYHWE